MNATELREFVEWNAPLCQYCFLNRCELKSYPEFKKYCSVCAPDDEDTLVFIIGKWFARKRIITTKENIRKFQKSIFNFILDSDITREHGNVFEVPIDTRYPIEIERLLQCNEVLTESKNEELEDEVFYFIGEEDKVDYLFETEDVCLCGNRKNKRFYDCKECRARTIREQAPKCISCRKNYVGWDKGRKRYFKNCTNCSNVTCKLCQINKPEWDPKNRKYSESCKFCRDYERKKFDVTKAKRICLECSSAWGQTVVHPKGECIIDRN